MRFFIFILSFILSGVVHGQSSKTSARVDGVASFLIDRANENYMFIFEKKLKENKDVQCFLPNTLKVLTISGQGGLKQLINSKSLWRDMLVKDLEVLTVRSVAYALQQELKISDLVVPINSQIIEVLQKVSIKDGDTQIRLDFNPYGATQELEAIVNGFSNPLESITSAMGEFKKYASKANSRDSICAAPIADIDVFKQSINGLVNLKKNLQAWSVHWDKHKDKFNLSADQQSADLQSAKNEIVKGFEKINKQTSQLVSILEVTGRNLKQINSEQNDVMPTIIEALDLLQKDKVLSNDAFQKFSRYSRFFGMLADATSSEEVKGILQSFTLPAVSFYLKREEGSHLMLTSYFGFALNANQNDGVEKQNNGFFVPVGLEYTLDKKMLGWDYEGAISIMASPFDFGYPVNLKLNGTSEDFEFNEIVAPSVTISYGLKEYPLVFGLGVQKGAKVGPDLDTENRLLLFVAFDMPLFNLFDL
jgi:methyl-accepting chemotaxis protein